MCRSIQTLRRAEATATDDDIRAAALQFVCKISGYRIPSRANAAAFDAAIIEIASSSRRLLDALAPQTPRTRAATASTSDRAAD
ncbi:MAG: DUF2277 family protein [Chloroflexi bacterium]|nr:MAG: DUF2277 family protein [Chloroflexota bacterium]